jgi:hypothetical protein
MKIKAMMAAAILLVAVPAYSADYYRCEGTDGKILITNTPCDEGMSQKVLREQEKPLPPAEPLPPAQESKPADNTKKER